MLSRYIVSLDPKITKEQFISQNTGGDIVVSIVSETEVNNIFTITTNNIDNIKGCKAVIPENSTIDVLLQSDALHLDYTVSGSEFQDWDPLYTGIGADIFLIDTGIDLDHEIFKTKDVRLLYSVDDNFEDKVGHGTLTAGLIIGDDIGSAPNCNLFCCKLFNETKSTLKLTEFLTCLDVISDALNTSKTSILCCPWVMERNAIVDDYLLSLSRKNVLIVCAAGNNASNVDNYSPAGVNDFLTVGAFLDGYQVAPFVNMPKTFVAEEVISSEHNYGKSIDIFAFGRASVPLFNTEAGYITVSGTSVATAITAGIAGHYVQKSIQTQSVILNQAAIKISMIDAGLSIGTNKLNFDSVSNFSAEDVNRSVTITEKRLKTLLGLELGLFVNIKQNKTLKLPIKIHDKASDIRILEFAPCPPWVNIDLKNEIIELSTESIDLELLPGIFAFAVRGLIDNEVVVEEYAIGVYVEAEAEITPNTAGYYYDLDEDEYDQIVSYQVAPKA